MAERLPLTYLPSVLTEAGYQPAPYRDLYEAARDCRIPAKPNKGGRWTFDPADLPTIAQAMGLADAHAA